MDHEQQSQSAKPTAKRSLRKIANTPVRNLIQGRVTGATSPKGIARELGLSGVLVDLVHSVVRKTRLREKERLAVARDLSQRFKAELGAGYLPSTIVERVGNIRRAARAIRKQKNRERHWLGRGIARVSSTAFYIVLVALIGITVRYHQGERVISHDYVAMLNARASNAPDRMCALPLLRDGLLDLRATLPSNYWNNDHSAAHPGAEGWEETARRLEESSGALGKIRAAAAMPYLGYVATDRLYEEDRALWPDLYDQQSLVFEEWMPLSAIVNLKFPFQSEMRRLMLTFSADAYRAAIEGDGQAALDDINACLGLARLSRETPTLINELQAHSIYAGSFWMIDSLIDGYPGLFTDSQLREIYIALLAIGNDTLRVSYQAEHWAVLDMIQRSYTDDGAGGGHFVGPELAPSSELGSVVKSWLGGIMNSIWSAFSLDRHDATRHIDNLFRDAEKNAEIPLWLHDWASPGEQPSTQRPGLRWRYSYVGLVSDMFIPVLDRPAINVEMLIMNRDSTITAVALERYRLRNGAWPESLDPLILEFLDSIPADRFDGLPLRYIYRGDEKPLLYSVGANFKDDGGISAFDEDGFPVVGGAGTWMAPSMIQAIKDGTYIDERDELTRLRWPIEETLPPDADFILWPPLPIKPVERELDPTEL